MFPGRSVWLAALPPLILLLSIASSLAVGEKPTSTEPPVTGVSMNTSTDFASNSLAADETVSKSGVVAEKVERAFENEGTPGILDNISIVETPNEALVIFATNGLVDYSVSTSAKLSRKWIEILFPTLKTGLPGHLAGGGRIVGEIYTEDLSPGSTGVKVSVEIIPSRIGYDFYQEGPSLVLRAFIQQDRFQGVK